MTIRGIIPPVATPMQANEDLDLPRLRSHLDFLIEGGLLTNFVIVHRQRWSASETRTSAQL